MTTSYYKGDKLCTFLSPKKVLLGVGAAKQTGKEAKALGAKKALIVTDKGVVNAGLLEDIKKSLEAENIQISIFDKVEPEPAARLADEGAQQAWDDDCNFIVGIGGGSSLDIAKGISIVATNKGKVVDYAGIDKVPEAGLPKILIPTTAGTGSEVSRALVITDESDNTKKVPISDFVLADVAIVDPVLTVSMPPTVTANSGIDALVHSIESYVNINATPYSDIWALEAIRIIADNLPTAYAKGNNMEARFNMAFAASLGAASFTTSGLGAVHGLAYCVGTEYHIPHGRANSIMLPHVMDYNKLGNLAKFANIAEALGENIEGLSLFEAAEMSVVAVERLLDNLNVSYNLTDYNIPKSDLPVLVKGGMAQARLFGVNPRDLTEKDVESIYKKALGD